MKFIHALVGALALTYSTLGAPLSPLAGVGSALAYDDAARPEAMVAAVVKESLTARSTRVDRRFARRLARAESGLGMLAGVRFDLAAKAREIAADCGSTVISGVRHTRVAGTRRMSLHASGRAVDMKGNPGCIYAHLRGWPGGYSTDYGRVQHVHISLGGGEDGLRFAHGGHRRHYARRHHHTRVAQRGA